MYDEENEWRKYDEYPFPGAREIYPCQHDDEE
jgi:hypothetical protein